MSRTAPSPRLLGALAVAGGLAWAGSAALQIARPDDVRSDTVTTTAAHLAIGGMALALVLSIAGLALLAQTVPGSRGLRAAATGQALLAIAATGANVKGSDPSWFVVAAPVANALWLGGSIAAARALRRAGSSRPVAFGLPLVWLGAIPLSLLGCGVLAGAYWIAVGLGAVLGPARASAAPATPVVVTP